MKALRWIIILVHGLDVDGAQEIGFIGKLIEDKNPDINFEDLSYISYYELNNQDNIFNVEVVSGILTTTIPAPVNAVENEENALTFIEDYYGLLLENKEYEIGFDPFVEGEVSGFLFYLSPYEPSVTTRNMVQKVKGSNKTKLPPIERKPAEITSRIPTEDPGQKHEWNSFVEDIGIEPQAPTNDTPSNEANEWSTTEPKTEQHSEWNSFVQDVAPNANEVEQPTTAPPQNTAPQNDQHSEWNSFVQDVAPNANEVEQPTTAPPQNTAPQNDQHSEWNSFVQDVAPNANEVEQPTTAPPQNTAPQNDQHSEWDSFVQDVAPQTSPTPQQEKNHEEWDSFVQGVTENETPQRTVSDSYAPPVEENESQEEEEPQRTVYKNPPTRRLQIPNLPTATDSEKPKNKEDWDEFLGALSGDQQQQQDQQQESAQMQKPMRTEQRVFPGNIQRTQQRPAGFSPNKPPEKKQSLSPTPVPFSTKDKNTSTTKIYTGNADQRRTSHLKVPPIPKVKMQKPTKNVDVMFDDEPAQKKKQIPRPKKKSFFRKMVTFVMFIVVLAGGTFAYLWFQQPVIAQDIIKQSQKYIEIAYAKIQELRGADKPIPKQQQVALSQLQTQIKSQPNKHYENMNKIIDFTKKFGNTPELQKIKGAQIKKITQHLTSKVNELKSISHYKQTQKLLNKYKTLQGLEGICKNLNKTLMTYAQNTTRQLIQISQNRAQKGEFEKALSSLEDKHDNLLPEMSTKLNKSKPQMLSLFLKKHIEQQTFEEGIKSLKNFLRKKVKHKEIKTEIYLLRLIHAEAMTYTAKDYQKALKVISKYKKISPYVDKNVAALRKDIPLHAQGQDILLNGLRYASKKKTYALSVRKKGKTYKLKGRIGYSRGLVVLKSNKRVRKFPMHELTLESLKQIFDEGIRVTTPQDKRYYEIGLYLLHHKQFTEAQKAFKACGRNAVGITKSEFYRF
ncbi:hypothetical protein [Candidatus Uabimicrobium amorphum]|uniref:hypothetical protein n=1 Tax=Uabimicrobium amorphum TaxID=2596890 RepID=UPI0034A5C96A